MAPAHFGSYNSLVLPLGLANAFRIDEYPQRGFQVVGCEWPMYPSVGGLMDLCIIAGDGYCNY